MTDLPLVSHHTKAPTRKIKAAGAGGIVLGVPLGQPMASLSLGLLNAVSPGTYEALAEIGDIKTALAQVFTVLIALVAGYLVRERLDG